MARASSPPDRRGATRGERSSRQTNGFDAVDARTIAAAARELPLALTETQSEQLARFVALLAKWNRVHNLTARESAADLLSLHLLDSLSIVAPLRPLLGRSAAGRAARVLDVGSGGGLPGIPLAIVEPDVHVTVLDKVAKKVAFLQQAKAELQLRNVECIARRIEEFEPAERYDVITARAYASLRDFVEGSRHVLADGGTWAAMKGAMPASEIAELPAEVEVRDIVKLRVPRLDAERHLVFLRTRAHA